jgi:hypothetical protein
VKPLNSAKRVLTMQLAFNNELTLKCVPKKPRE